MDSSRYIDVDNKIYHIDLRTLPKSSMLHYILTNEGSILIKKKHVSYEGKDMDIPYIKNSEDNSIRYFNHLVTYLNTGKVINVNKLEVLLDFFGIFTFKTKSYPSKFRAFKLEEEWDRRNRYNPYFEDIFKDPYLNLVELSNIEVNHIELRFILLNIALTGKKVISEDGYDTAAIFDQGRQLLNKLHDTYGRSIISILKSWSCEEIIYGDYKSHVDTDSDTISNRIHDMKNLLTDMILFRYPPSNLHDIDKLFWDGHIVVAGGSIISLLQKDRVNDIDCFFVGLDADEIRERIEQILDLKHRSVYVTRSANAVTIGKVQFILRAYKNVSEVIHGFDIDASCIAFDGTKIWTTKRCKYALDNLVNTVDFDRMSPSYEYRLIKYMKQKMFSIYIPDFDINNVRLNVINTSPRRSEHKGLDYILYYSMVLSHVPVSTPISDYEDVIHYYIEGLSDKWLKDKSITKITFNVFKSKSPNSITSIPYSIYKTGYIKVPRKIEIKVLSPGDQATNTFHVTVLEDISKWYEGRFYTMKSS